MPVWNNRQSMTFPGRWTVVSSVRIKRTGPKKGLVRSIPRRRKVYLICSRESGSRLNFACEPWFGPESRRQVVLFPDVVQSELLKGSVMSTPSPGGGVSESTSFTRIAMPAVVENGRMTSMKFPAPLIVAVPGPAEGNVRMTSLVTCRSMPLTYSPSQMRSEFASPPPPSEQLPDAHVSGTEQVSPLSHSASVVHACTGVACTKAKELTNRSSAYRGAFHMSKPPTMVDRPRST